MKVLLIYPRFKYPTGDPPLGLLYVASFLRKSYKEGLDLDLFDATFNPSFDELTRLIIEKKPDIVGIYCNTLMFQDVLKIAWISKIGGAITVIGGPHPTIKPESFSACSDVDFIVVGEGERIFLDIVKHVGEGLDFPSDVLVSRSGKALVLRAKGKPLVDNLDDLPFPCHELLDMEKYIENWFQMDIVNPDLKGTNIIASRGCPYQCSYCQPTLKMLFGKRVRIRSPENVISELKYLKRRFGLNSFIFADDTPTFFKSWMEDFCNLLIDEGLDFIWGCNTRVGLLDDGLLKLMYRSGFRRLMVGIESANQRILDDYYNKGIKASDVLPFCRMVKMNRIRIFGYFMLGAPTETLDEINRTINFAFTLPIDEATFSITTPLPGTYLAEKFRSAGLLADDDFSSLDYYRSSGKISSISSRTLRRLQRVAFLKFYLHPRRWRYLINSFLKYSGLKKSFLKIQRLFNI
ncbi:MAG: B12-binding domain-containing radical SAM protein [Promethearchaeota archaeon]